MDDWAAKFPPISKPSVSSPPDSARFLHQDSVMTESVCKEWTNERHSLYLKSMEASFVDQLYDSVDLIDLQMPKGTSGRNISTSSSQFKVLRGGCWKKINFQKPETRVNITTEPHEILANPWVQHFKSARTSQVSPHKSDASLLQPTNNLNEKKTGSCGKTASSKHSYPCHDDMAGFNTAGAHVEVSDQNFEDEDVETEKKSSSCSTKRLKARAKRRSK